MVHLHFPAAARWFAKTQRQEGYDVSVEGLSELPDEMVPSWMLEELVRLMPPVRREEMAELGRLAVERAQRLRSNHLAERAGEQLFVAVDPESDEVLDLVFNRGQGLTFARVDGEWVRSYGVGDLDFHCYAMVPVRDNALPLYDKCRALDNELMLAELRANGVLTSPSN